ISWRPSVIVVLRVAHHLVVRSPRSSFFFSCSAHPRDLHSSLHDALPISASSMVAVMRQPSQEHPQQPSAATQPPSQHHATPTGRSEEHTSELQSRFDLVCRLLLEKKKEE